MMGLRDLYLTYNELGDEGARAIARWPGLRRVEVLSLDGNGIGRKGLEALDGALEGRTARPFFVDGRRVPPERGHLALVD
jgi:hypothetical protein